MMKLGRGLFHIFVGGESFERGGEASSADGEGGGGSVDAGGAGIRRQMRLQSGAGSALLAAQQRRSPIHVAPLLECLVLRRGKTRKNERGIEEITLSFDNNHNDDARRGRRK